MDRDYVIEFIKNELGFVASKDVINQKAENIAVMVEREVRTEKRMSVRYFVDFLKKKISAEEFKLIDNLMEEYLRGK